MAYTRAGLAPDGGSTFYLPRLVGPRRAKELLLTNRTLTAHQALEWGLVNRVDDDDALAAATSDLARHLAAGATRAYGFVKRLVSLGSGDALETQMEHEARAIVEAAGTADAREGIAAFVAKRQPRFTGR
jgi:2-(1,2-epoxy-1,2-dihydrophenyl)acetyl-CoA isomerase